MSTSLKVLVVDDEQPARDELCYQLEQLADVEVVAQAGNGVEALAAVDRVEPDLIFLDIVLPGMNGFKALRVIRRDDRTLRIPVIMISGNQQATDQFWVQKIGADEFMVP